MSKYNIPRELQELKQWVGAKKDGTPIDPATGYPASSTDPKQWATFDEACACGTEYVAFVLTPDDPYVIIDLDTDKNMSKSELHYNIITSLDSYTEVSKNGVNTHIVCRAPDCIANFNNRQHCVELYSQNKTITLTGDTFFCHAVEDCSAQIADLVETYQPVQAAVEKLTSTESSLSDDDLVAKILDSGNGDKFNKLHEKDDVIASWYHRDGKFDHSAADAALIAILDFYTQDADQVKRIFESSALYRPEKIKKSKRYFEITLKRVRAAQKQRSLVADPYVPELTPRSSKLADIKTQTPDTDFAPGLLGRITQYIYDAATRQVYEVALAGAIAFMAGICGRYYNISHTGLNQYLLLLAETGIGKDSASEGIALLIDAICEYDKTVLEHVGAGDYSSGQGLLRMLSDNPCIFAIVGEFGKRIKVMADANTNNAERTLERTLLDLYKKSGAHNFEKGRSNAKKEDSATAIRAPSLTLLGETTQSSFFPTLNEEMIESGLLPRFMFIEYTGPRNPSNPNAFGKPPNHLVSDLVLLINTCARMNRNEQHVPVTITSDAQKLLGAFSDECDDKINNGTSVAKQLWNRAHLKLLRLSGLIAVGCSFDNPVVTSDIVKWAEVIIRRDVSIILTRFEAGEVGQGDHRLVPELLDMCREWFNKPVGPRINEGVVEAIAEHKGVLPHSWLVFRAAKCPTFKNARLGISTALTKALNDLTKSGYLVKLSDNQSRELIGTEIDLYKCGPMLR